MRWCSRTQFRLATAEIICHLVAEVGALILILGTDSNHFKLRGVHLGVGQNHHADFIACFNFISRTLLIEQEVATETGTIARTLLNSFCASSSIRRKLTTPGIGYREWCLALQRGQTLDMVSSREGRRRCRDISSRPNREIRPTWTRARSIFSASRVLFSTSFW